MRSTSRRCCAPVAPRLRSAFAIRTPCIAPRSCCATSARSVSADMYGRPTDAPPPLLIHLDPLDPAAAMEALNTVRETLGVPQHALVLPARGVATPGRQAQSHRGTARRGGRRVGATTAAGRTRRRGGDWRGCSRGSGTNSAAISHRVLFMTNQDDRRAATASPSILRAGVEQLCRVWRHESELGSGQCEAARAASEDEARTGRALTAPSGAGVVQSARALYQRRTRRPRLRGWLGRAASGQRQARRRDQPLSPRSSRGLDRHPHPWLRLQRKPVRHAHGQGRADYRRLGRHRRADRTAARDLGRARDARRAPGRRARADARADRARGARRRIPRSREAGRGARQLRRLGRVVVERGWWSTRSPSSAASTT